MKLIMVIIAFYSTNLIAANLKKDLKVIDVSGDKREEVRDQEIEWIQKETYGQTKNLNNLKTKKELYNNLKNTTGEMLSEFKGYRNEKSEAQGLIDQYNKEFQCSEDPTKCNEVEAIPTQTVSSQVFDREKFIKIVFSYRSEFETCYNNLLKMYPESEIKYANLMGYINTNGSLELDKSKSSISEPILENCIDSVIGKIQVDQVDKKMAFNQPLSFKKHLK
ncbi:MAG: hypothetical protein ACOYL6_17565 [Bacteriovoracaceae bacterium]